MIWNTRKSFTLCLIVSILISTMISLILYFEGHVGEEEDMRKLQTDTKHWQSANCTYQGYTSVSFGCANVISCRCHECSTFAGSCSAMVGSLTAGECCNGYHCCAYRTKYCRRWSSCCRRTCRGSGKDRKCKCQGCYKEVKCGRTCTSSVSNRQCQVAVGTCHNLKIDLHFAGFVKTITHGCGRDDFACANNWVHQFHDSECYYDNRNPIGTVRTVPFDSSGTRNDGFYVATWVFAGIAMFCAFCLIVIGLTTDAFGDFVSGIAQSCSTCLSGSVVFVAGRICPEQPSEPSSETTPEPSTELSESYEYYYDEEAPPTHWKPKAPPPPRNPKAPPPPRNPKAPPTYLRESGLKLPTYDEAIE